LRREDAYLRAARLSHQSRTTTRLTILARVIIVTYSLESHWPRYVPVCAQFPRRLSLLPQRFSPTW